MAGFCLNYEHISKVQKKLFNGCFLKRNVIFNIVHVFSNLYFNLKAVHSCKFVFLLHHSKHVIFIDFHPIYICVAQ